MNPPLVRACEAQQEADGLPSAPKCGKLGTPKICIELTLLQAKGDAALSAHYHVGWICAVQTEYVVACEFLDEEYPTPATRPLQDNNTYTFGRIVACLPKGKYVLTSAASVARDMLRSFTSIRFGLMVGNGGGTPSPKRDIRLGDVVVSSPAGRTGGVIHYEFGKTTQNQKLERTGAPNAPPAILLTALSMVEARHERKKHRIVKSVNG